MWNEVCELDRGADEAGTSIQDIASIPGIGLRMGLDISRDGEFLTLESPG